MVSVRLKQKPIEKLLEHNLAFKAELSSPLSTAFFCGSMLHLLGRDEMDIFTLIALE